MSSAGDETGIKFPYSTIAYVMQLFFRVIQPYVDKLMEIVEVSVNYDVGESGKGYFSLRLSDYPEDKRKDVLRVLYGIRDNARLTAAIIRSLGFDVDVKASARKGILMLWRKRVSKSQKEGE